MRTSRVAIIIASAAVLSAALWSLRSGTSARAAAGPVLDTTTVVRRDVRRTVKATGVVKPRVGAEVRVGSRVSGVVRRLFVRIGDTVTRGQVLAEVDDRELTAQRREADAARVAAEADRGFQRAELARRRELAAQGLISESELDAFHRAFDLADAQVLQRRASLAAADTQLGYARVVAPIAGVVSAVATQEGETVAASFAAPTFVTLLDLSRLEVWAYVDETDIGRIALGQEALFTVDTYGGEEFLGHVTAIYPQAEIRDNVVDYVAVVSFEPPPDRVLRPEMTATINVALAQRTGVLTVPLRAVRREGGRPYVLLPAAGDAKPERRFVTLGERDESGWEITDGLRDNDTILLGDPGPQEK